MNRLSAIPIYTSLNPILIMTAVSLAVVLFYLAFMPSQANAAFVHPGLLNNRSELDFIKAKVQTGQNPWISGYNALKTENNYLNHSPQAIADVQAEAYRNDDGDRDKIIDDAEVVYGSSLQWYITGDARYAQKAIQIMDAWSNTFNKCTGSDCPLAMAYAWPPMIWGAEIIKHTYSGWSAADQAEFTNLLNNKVWNYVKNGTTIANCNWEAWMIANMYSIAVFTDSTDKFNHAKTYWDKRLPLCIYASGEPQETCRDLHHTQMGLAPLTIAAEIAWHQGVDLYASLDNRLLKGVEFTVPLALGEKPAYAPSCTLNEVGSIWPFYEMVLNHYNFRKGMNVPQTQRMVTENRPEWFGRVGWGTFTHVQLAGGPPVTGTPITPITGAPTSPVTPVIPVPAGCIASSTQWKNTAITAQTGTFRIDFDATPGRGDIDSTFGLSNGSASSFTVLAAIVRFNRDGFIDVRNGNVYQSLLQKTYTAGVKYSFRMEVDMKQHNYDVYVSESGVEQLLANDYAFRSEQATVATLSNWNTNAVSGSATYCNIKLNAQPSISPGQSSGTALKLNIFLHGIGKGGDNVNAASGGTRDPIRTQRPLTVEIIDINNQSVSKQGNMLFDSTLGNFQGTIDTGALISGSYTLKVKVPQYLKKNIPGIYTLGTTQVPQIASVSLTTGDTNNDNVLSVLDYNIILDCFADFGTPRNCSDSGKKQNADLTDDTLVNQFDYNLFIRELSVQQGQ